MPSFISDFGWTATEIIRQAAIAYVAVTNTRAAIEIAKLQQGIAKSYLDLSVELRTIWKDVYLENERKLTSDLFNTPKPTANYALWAGRAGSVVAVQFAETRRRIAAYSPKFCCGDAGQRMMEVDIAEATARGDALMYGMRFADAKQLALDDRLYSRQHAAISLGRGLGMAAQTYASAAAGLYGQLGQQAAAGASGAIGALGYFSTRKSPGDQTAAPFAQRQVNTKSPFEDEGPSSGMTSGSASTLEVLQPRGFDIQPYNGGDSFMNGSPTNPAVPASTGITGIPQMTPPDLIDVVGDSLI